MPVVQHAGLYPVPFLAVGTLGLTADRIGDARRGHEIAFVGRVDEHPAGVAAAAEHGDRGDARAVLPHAAGAVQPLAAVDLDAVLANQVFEHLLGHVRLEIHIVRCVPSIAGVPWPLLPYSSRFCHFHAAGLSYCAQMRW